MFTHNCQVGLLRGRGAMGPRLKDDLSTLQSFLSSLNMNYNIQNIEINFKSLKRFKLFSNKFSKQIKVKHGDRLISLNIVSKI